MPELTVVTWLWAGQKKAFLPEYANRLASMFGRCCTIPHRFVCITDFPADKFESRVDVVRMPESAQSMRGIRSPEGAGFPSCYRRLWVFSDEARALGERILSVDLDVVLTGNIDHIAALDAPFVGWVPGDNVWNGRRRYGGGLYLLRTGAHPEVWRDFNGVQSIRAARRAGYRGSDQAWLNFKLYGRSARIPSDAGVVMFRPWAKRPERLPVGRVCMVQFSGPRKPWNHTHVSWVKKHWR